MIKFNLKNYINVENLSSYLKTILWTILGMFIVMIILLAIIQHNVYKAQMIEDSQDENLQYYLIGVLIDKNKYLESQYPKNYRINLKLGILYELDRDYKTSETELKIAIEKAPYGEFSPNYKLADLYLTENRLDEAQKTMDSIDERPDKILIGYKADIYKKLGDKYYEKSDYETSIDMYQKALSYYKIIKSHEIPDLKNSMASAYVYLGENQVAQLDIDDAIDSLQMANSFVDAPIIKYKLAILLIKSNPQQAYRYFVEVFEKEPSLINFDVYYNFLSSLADSADLEGDIGKAELFRFKAKKFKEYFDTNILSVNDVGIAYIDGQMSYNSWKKKYTLNLELQLRNTSYKDLKSLYIDVVFRNNQGEVITEYLEKVVDSGAVLAPDAISPVINIRTYVPNVKNYSPNENITAEVSVSKLEKSYKINLASVPMQEVKRIKRKKANWKKDLKLWWMNFRHEHNIKHFELKHTKK